MPERTPAVENVLGLSPWRATALAVLALIPGRVVPTSQGAHDHSTGVAVDTTVLSRFADSIAAGTFGYIDGILVMRDSHVVFERMFPRSYASVYPMTDPPGPFNYHDPNWHPYYHGTSLHTQQSVTKSVTSMLYGIALARRDLSSIDQPIAPFFPAQARFFSSDSLKRRITIRHLLTMTSGIHWPEGGSYDASQDLTGRMERSADWVPIVLEQPMEAEPGTHWSYSSGAAALLGALFRAATKQDIQDYARDHLFGPLGIHFFWKRSAGGLTDTEGGLYLDIRDMAKLGQLYLQGGRWGDRQIVPRQWVEESVVPQFTRAGDGYRYGRLWWMMPKGALRDTSEFNADGYGGQYIVVLPRWRTVAVMTGWNLDRRPVRPDDFARRVERAVAGTP